MRTAQPARPSKAEIVELRARLAEAEDTLNAIRRGDVDAIAVDGPAGRQIFTLQSADQPYRVLAEQMSEGAASLTSDGTLIFCNQRISTLTGVAPEKLAGSFIGHVIAEPERDRFAQLLTHALESEARGEFNFQCPDGKLRPVLVSLKSIPADLGRGLCMVAVDLSERRQTESKLREQAALLDLAHDAILLRSMEGRILFWNRGALDLYGWPAEDALGQITQELLQTNFPKPLDEIVAIIEGTREWEGELAQVTRGGQPLVVMSRWSLLRDEDGRPVSILEINRDITERKHAEKELGLARERLALAFKTGQLGSFDWNIQDGEYRWSAEAKELYGLAQGEFGGRYANWEALVSPEDLPFAREAIARSLKTGEFQSEWRIRRARDGEVRWISARAKVFFDAQGVPQRMIGVNLDVTDRKRAEEQLRTASLYTRSLIEASLDPLVTISREGKITDVNSATEKVTGISREQLIGTNFCDYFTDPEQAKRGYLEVFAAGLVHDYPLAIRDRSGAVTDVLYNASTFRNEAGEVQGVFAAARDITDRKKAEEALHKLNDELEERVHQRTEELLNVNKELESFNYAVAHDLRAPLRHIHGFAEILSEEAEAKLDESAKHHLEVIRGSVGRMEQLLEDLLNLARLGRQPLRKQTEKLRPIVDEVIESMNADSEGRTVEWRVADLPLIECDRSLLKQVFFNLLSNALKFTRSRENAVIEVGETIREGEPVIFVRDNGVGFDMKYVEKLFGLFQRLHRQQDFEGTGVGLAIVQRIVRRHGGRIWAEAELNKGATFYLWLPNTRIKTEVQVTGYEYA